MQTTALKYLLLATTPILLAACQMAPTRPSAPGLADASTDRPGFCQLFGPQTPRDIDASAGTNRRVFSFAPAYQQLNLCNLHLHTNAEHKARDFSIYAGHGNEQGVGGGYRCNMSTTLTEAERRVPSADICNGLKPGDTIEVHWVYSSCDVQPGPKLDSCSSTSCANPQLRVETQVFTLVNDARALNFGDFDYAGHIENGYHQAKSLPQGTGVPVRFLGSTTGHDFNNQTCSPLQVSWSVRPMCAKLDINSLGRWCQDNVFDEKKAHGVRELVTEAELLSTIPRPSGSD
jgi:hypothetical protein